MQEELCLTKQQQRSKQHGFLLTACLVLILLLVALTTAIAVLVARDYTSSRVITATVEDEEARSVLTHELALQQLQAELHAMKSDANEMKNLLLAAIQNRDVGYEAPPHSRRKRRADENETWPLSRLGTNATAVETAESTVVTSGGVTLGEEIENLRRRVDMLASDALLAGSTNASSREGGAVYVRWGRTSCPETGAELIYDGVAGNSHHTHTGGGGDYQCLPNDPQWGRYSDGFQGKNYIYGVEHEINGYNPFLDSHLSGEALHNQDAVCAVCRTQGRASKLMIPAWKTCPQSWTLEYHGYLASEHTTHKGRTNFVCVDEDPDVRPGGVTSVDGGLWYVVEAACGALPCPRYVTGRELTCVVCTK